ncbi:Hypothetical protein MHO_3710 [Metamycoplasma hominis ATCC 23114]|uniref:Uncharacterized protein n=1 Tax=Metamycoplasma hominis (strain ATCC 23114 / DSM 25592 / NBRC 14850 / NCTC 10111 / PG21) TaxID=347256 RepID=D1J8F9_METH1|nr:hypothetical protein [Metamycoplasma hominis]CAX37506.1 Hypothetical protein MHO_3710 [Metamycoplasma hominis ATCC 23114]
MNSKKSKKIVVALSLTLIASAITIPVVISSLIENKNNWANKYYSQRSEASHLVNLIEKNRHFYYFALEDQNNLNKLLSEINLTSKNSSADFKNSYNLLNKTNLDINKKININKKEFDKTYSDILLLSLQLQDLFNKIIDLKLNNNIKEDVDGLLQRVEKDLNKCRKIDENINLIDIKEIYAHSSKTIIDVSNQLNSYYKLINSKDKTYKGIVSEIKDLKKDYFNKIEDGEEYYKLYGNEINHLKKNFKNFQSVEDYNNYINYANSKIKEIKEEIVEHRKLSQKIKKDGNDILNNDYGKSALIRNSYFQEPKSFLLMWNTFTKLDMLIKAKFINERPKQIKEFLKQYEERQEYFYRINENVPNLIYTWVIYNNKIRIIKEFYFKDKKENEEFNSFYYKDEDIDNQLNSFLNEEREFKNRQERLVRLFYDKVIQNPKTNEIDEEKLMKLDDIHFDPEQDIRYLHYHFGSLITQKVNEIIRYYNQKAKTLLEKIKNNNSYETQKNRIEKLLAKNITYVNNFRGDFNDYDKYYWWTYKFQKDNNGDIILSPNSKIPDFYKNEIEVAQYLHELDEILDNLKNI